MKKIFTLCSILSLTILSVESKAQFTANFESDITAMTSNCWSFTQMNWTNDPADVISGSGSLYSNPPTNGSSTRDTYTPALKINSTSFTVSFDYKVSSKISGNATRTIEIGLLDASTNYTVLNTVTMDKNSPTTVQHYTNNFTVTTGLKKLVIKIGGATGDGNSRIIFDNLVTSASSQYGPSNTCNSAPVAADDVVSGTVGAPVNGNVLSNDSDPNGETLTPSIVTTSPDGVVVLNTDGNFVFTPNSSFTGFTTSFTYRVNDNGFAPLNSGIATVTINLSTLSPLGTLPVNLISFQGNLDKNNKVTLTWKNADNENTDHFEVERSANGKDFAPVAVLFATETKGAENYTYSETVNSTDKVMYRLKMFDKRQEINYSKIIVFQTKTTTNSSSLRIFGNPVNDKLTFSYTSSSTQLTEVKVYDMSGKTVMSQKVNSFEGNNMTSLPLNSTFQSGLYIVEVNNGTERQTAKFVKQ